MAQRRRIARVLASLGTACAFTACAMTEDVSTSWSVEQQPANTGVSAIVTVRIWPGLGGPPIPGARLSLEGHMSHPGMAPVVAPMTDRGDGRYQARLPLTMTGEWSLVITGRLPSGSRIVEEHRIEVGDAAPPA
jgi:hypothetical protein